MEWIAAFIRSTSASTPIRTACRTGEVEGSTIWSAWDYPDSWGSTTPALTETLPKILARGETVDFAFIDGWHTFDYVLGDFFFVNKLLRPGGTVVLDDADQPPIRKFLRYTLTNMDYSIVRTLSRPLSSRRRTLNAISAAFNRLCAASSLQRFLHRLLRPEFLNPDERLGLNGRCVALRKERNDRRRWDYHAEF
jgi:hypothetical protein